MRKAYWFAAASIAVMILASAGGWTIIMTAPAAATKTVGASVQVDPMQAMKNAKNLPAPHYDDYSIVFD